MIFSLELLISSSFFKYEFKFIWTLFETYVYHLLFEFIWTLLSLIECIKFSFIYTYFIDIYIDFS